MVVRVSNTSDKPEASTEVRPLSHDKFFTVTFQRKRLARSFLRILLPKKLLELLDLDGIVAEPRHITDELFQHLIADVVFRVPVKGTDKHIDFFILLEHKSWVRLKYACLEHQVGGRRFDNNVRLFMLN